MTIAMPNVVHPTTFQINGYQIRVATYFEVTTAQAAKIAARGFAQRKWLKKDLKKVHTIVWIGDRDALALL